MGHFLHLNNKAKIILIILCCGMFTGSVTHADWIIKNGFLSNNYDAPLYAMVFWDILSFIDPVAALLLLIKPKHGIWLAAIIMMADVLINSYMCVYDGCLYQTNFTNWLKLNWMLVAQISFAVFLLSTINYVLKAIRDCSDSSKLEISDNNANE